MGGFVRALKKEDVILYLFAGGLYIIQRSSYGMS